MTASGDTRARAKQNHPHMSIERTRATMTAYLETVVDGGPVGNYLAPDATLTMMDSGGVTHGRDAIAGVIDFIHTRAFAAGMELEALVVDEGRAMIEAIFAGVHTGEFGGLAPTGRAVRVQYAVAFDLAGDAITALRVYLPLEALARQVRHG